MSEPIALYTWSTPNGRKVSIMLEELGLAYSVHPIDITRDEQSAAAFDALTPNRKIPVIVDPDGPNGRQLTLFESGAILLYLSRKSGGALLPRDPAGEAIAIQWLMFQMGGIGPMFGQLHHFKRHAPGEAYGLARYGREVRRLYGVLDRRLAEVPFLAGEKYSLADVATYPWVARFALHDVAWSDFEHVARWFESVGSRPAVRRGMAVPG